jgi:hypothetical protein
MNIMAFMALKKRVPSNKILHIPSEWDDRPPLSLRDLDGYEVPLCLP